MKDLVATADVVVGVARVIPQSLVIIVALPVALVASLAPKRTGVTALRVLQELTRLMMALSGRSDLIVIKGEEANARSGWRARR
jgi:hypothetical protein